MTLAELQDLPSDAYEKIMAMSEEELKIYLGPEILTSEPDIKFPDELEIESEENKKPKKAKKSKKEKDKVISDSDFEKLMEGVLGEEDKTKLKDKF